MYDQESLSRIFSLKTSTDEEAGRISALHVAALEFAMVIFDNTHGCPDQTVAIRKIREALGAAVDAVLLDGRS